MSKANDDYLRNGPISPIGQPPPEDATQEIANCDEGFTPDALCIVRDYLTNLFDKESVVFTVVSKFSLMGCRRKWDPNFSFTRAKDIVHAYIDGSRHSTKPTTNHFNKNFLLKS
jgi:hypothetical protein